MIVTDFQREVIKELCTKQAEPGGSMTIQTERMSESQWTRELGELAITDWIREDTVPERREMVTFRNRTINRQRWILEEGEFIDTVRHFARGPLFETQLPGVLALAGVFISSAELAQISPEQLADASVWCDVMQVQGRHPKPLWLDLLEGPAIEEGCEVAVDLEGYVHAMNGPTLIYGQQDRLHRDPRLNYQPTLQVIFKMPIGFAVSSGWANGDIDVALRGDWRETLSDLRPTWKARPLNLTITGLSSAAYRLQVAPISKLDGPTFATEEEKRALAILRPPPRDFIRQLAEERLERFRGGAGSQWPYDHAIDSLNYALNGAHIDAAQRVAALTGMSVDRVLRSIAAVVRAGTPATVRMPDEDEGA